MTETDLTQNTDNSRNVGEFDLRYVLEMLQGAVDIENSSLFGYQKQIPLIRERVASSLMKTGENASVKENPQRKEWASVIDDGIKDFRSKHPDIDLKWQKGNYAELKKFCVEAARKLPPRLIQTLPETVKSKLPPQFYVIFSLDVLSPEVRHAVQNAIADEQLLNQWDQRALLDMQHSVETLFEKKSGQPVALSELFCICLTRSNGNINEALALAYTFLKYVSRELKDDFWMKQYIADELSDFTPYNQYNPKPLYNVPNNYESDLMNQIGKPYHAFHLTYLMSVLPIEIINLLVMAEYGMFGKEQGYNKLLSDLRVLSDLPKIEMLLDQFKMNKPSLNETSIAIDKFPFADTDPDILGRNIMHDTMNRLRAKMVSLGFSNREIELSFSEMGETNIPIFEAETKDSSERKKYEKLFQALVDAHKADNVTVVNISHNDLSGVFMAARKQLAEIAYKVLRVQVDTSELDHYLVAYKKIIAEFLL